MKLINKNGINETGRRSGIYKAFKGRRRVRYKRRKKRNIKSIRSGAIDCVEKDLAFGKLGLSAVPDVYRGSGTAQAFP